MNLTAPFTVTVRVDPAANPTLAEAIITMRSLGWSLDDLLEAYINGISATYYMAARRTGHSHDEIMNNKLFVAQIYLKLREKQGCSADEALEVYRLTVDRLPAGSYAGKNMRAMYRAAREAKLSHADAIQAMGMEYICYAQHDWVPRAEMGQPNRILNFFKAAARQILFDDEAIDLDIIWRTWCTACNKPPTDLPPLESLLPPADA